MCGIVGYAGRDDAAAILTPALKRLEYRGYDSAGLATLNGHGIEVRKSVGKIAALEALVRAHAPQGRVGIAHTRWATHGRPSDANAHPHLDCTGRIAIVHNGIIENHQQLRQRLLGDGHAFASETDTEVIAHPIESYQGEPLLEAVRRAAAELRGSFAIACIAENDPATIIAVRSGTSPLVVAWTGTDAYVASDTPALVGRCTETFALEDGDVAVLTPGGIAIERLTGGAVSRAGRPIAHAVTDVNKGAFADFMLKEIFEQPPVIAAAWRERVRENGRTLELQDAGVPAELFANVERLIVLGCGTSLHAGLVAKYLIEELARVPVEVAIASECRHRAPIYSSEVLAVPISQSGETADTLAALRQAQRAGARSLAICNVPTSSLAREANATIDTLAGLEIGVAATKSFTAQVLAVTWLALRFATARGTLDATQARALAQAVCRVPRLMEDMLGQSDTIKRLAERYADHEHCLYLGRGLQYPLALEGALKLKEISYVHAEGCAAGEMKHGPIALLAPGALVVALAPTGPTIDSMASNIQEVKARDAVVLALATRGERTIADLADDVIEVPPAPAWIQPLVLAVPLQLFAYHLAKTRGCDVDQPRNLAKSVTVE